MLSLLELSLTGGVFILAVVVVRALAMNRLPRQAFLLLWAVALARLLLPFSIPSPTSLYSAASVPPAVTMPARRKPSPRCPAAE